MSVPELYRRVGGRRRFHKTRQEQAANRRQQVLRLLLHTQGGRGARTRIAEALNVDPTTIGRDLARLRQEQRCPCCGQPRP
jgi:hypothetical protein